MKVAVALCLFACAAVSHAAFSGSLVQQAKPLLNQALFNVRLTTAGRDSNLDVSVVEELSNYIQSILAQIESGAALASGMYDQILAELQNAQASMAQLVGGMAGGVSQIVSSLLENLSSMWSGLFGTAQSRGIFDIFSGLGSLNIPAIIQAIKDKIAEHLSSIDIIAWVAQKFNISPALVSTIWNMFSGLIGNGSERGLLDGLAGLGSQVIQQITGILAGLQSQVGPILAQIQALAQAHIQAALSQAGPIIAQAQALLQQLQAHQGDLGALFPMIVAQLQQIIAAVQN